MMDSQPLRRNFSPKKEISRQPKRCTTYVLHTIHGNGRPTNGRGRTESTFAAVAGSWSEVGGGREVKHRNSWKTKTCFS